MFQKVMMGLGRPTPLDSLVKVMTPKGFSSTTHTVYTIVNLNYFFQRDPEGKEHYKNLENHPDIMAYAPELHAELSGQAFLP